MRRVIILIIRLSLFACFVSMWAFMFWNVENKTIISKEENRVLSTFPALSVDGHLNLKFGSELDAYLKDHFPHRQDLISNYLKLTYFINGRLENKYVIGGEEGWLFHKNTVFQHLTFNNDALKLMSEKLERLNSILKQNGITLVVVAVPFKAHVYFEYLTPFIDTQKINNYTLFLKEYIQKHNPDVRFLYPLDALLREKNNFPNPLYQKGDHHPSGWGYFVLYRELMQAIQKDFPDVVIYGAEAFKEKQKQFGLGSERRELGFSDVVSEYPKLTFKEKYQIKTERKGSHAYWKNVYEPGQYHVFFLGSSMGMEIHQMMFPSFKKVIFMRDNAEKNFDSNEDIFPDLLDILKQEKIDIFILEMPEDRIVSNRFSERLSDILNEHKEK